MISIPWFTSMKPSHSMAAPPAFTHLTLKWIPCLRLLLLLLAPVLSSASAEGVAKVLDDYSDPTRNRCGVERLLIDDRTAGSKSKAAVTCEKGTLRVQGDLVPGRGVPAFISQVSLLAPEGKARDLSGYQGIRLRVKVIKGILFDAVMAHVQVCTSLLGGAR